MSPFCFLKFGFSMEIKAELLESALLPFDFLLVNIRQKRYMGGYLVYTSLHRRFFWGKVRAVDPWTWFGGPGLDGPGIAKK